jgi:Ca2+-binding EF-hand superfamily protein
MQTRKLTIALGALVAGAAFGPAALAWNNPSHSRQMDQQVRQMDTNNDGTVSQSEFNTYWQQQFKTADTNNDGKLSKQEARTADEHMNGSIKIDRSSFDRMWTTADTNNDGSLSRSEDLAYHDKMFRQADSNDDGKLSRAEIASAVHNRDESVASL